MGQITSTAAASITVSTWLDSLGTDIAADTTGAITDSLTEIPVDDDSVFAAGDVVTLGKGLTNGVNPSNNGEIIFVQGKTGGGVIVVIRGYAGTTPNAQTGARDIYKLNIAKDNSTLKVGNGNPFSGTVGENVALFRIAIPTRESLGIPSNSILRGLDMKLDYVGSPAGDVFTVYSLKSEFQNFRESTAAWPYYDKGFGAAWTPGHYATNPIYDKFINGFTKTSAIDTVVLDAGIALHGWDFGDDVGLVMYGSTETASEINDDQDNSASDAVPQFVLDYEVPTPSGPVISIKPQSNGIDGLITIDTGSDSKDLQSHEVCWSTSDPIPDHGDNPTVFSDAGRTTFDTLGLSGSPLATDDTAYYFTVIAEDTVNTDDNGGVSNVAYVIRPEVATGSCTLTSSGAIGDTMTLVVASETVSSHPYTGKFKKVLVNWDTAASDTDDDYATYTSEDHLSTTSGNITIEHKYSKAATYTVKVIIEDADGWRSDKATIGTTPAIAESNPVANLTTSRTKVLEATYGEKSAAMVLSGQHSKAIGSDRKIDNYLFSYEADTATTLVTSGAYNNDNSVFDSGSKRVAMISMGADAMNTAQFKVFGLASFTSNDSTPVTDTDTTNFSHYRQAVDTITIDATRYAGGGETIFTESQATTPNYFKTVDCVMCVASDSDDDADRYALCVFSSDEVVTANSVFRSPINTEIRWKSNPTSTNKSLKYAWGGFSQISAGNVDFVTKSLTITDLDVALPVATVTTDGSHNLEVGDYIHINASNDDGTHN